MRTLFTVTTLALLSRAPARAADWPQWRLDARRSAVSADALPDALHLRWVRKYPSLRPAHWQVRQVRQQFDLGYEPVVAGDPPFQGLPASGGGGGTVFVASSLNDSVTAIDLDTGAETWRFYADGPVRLAPVVHGRRVMFGSDDGSFYCLAAADGKLLWRRRGCPSTRKVIGDGRLISVWPVRGGPVAREGNVYFAAGVWPFEGIFVWALDADTGRTVWLNDRTGSLYLRHPHGAMAFGGPSPQGYLLVHRGELIVPSGRAFPAFFDLETGVLKEFAFGHGGHGSRPGGWFVTVDPSGALHVDPEVNSDIHDEGRQRIGQERIRGRNGMKLAKRVSVGTRSYKVTRGARRTVVLGGKTFDFAAGFPGVVGSIHTMLAARGRLLVVTREGGIHCFSGEAGDPKVYETTRAALSRPDDGWAERAGEILAQVGRRKGYALVLGLGTGRLAEELLWQSQLHVIAVDTDSKKVDAFRRRLDGAGLYGPWVAAFAARPGELTLPPHFATLIVSEDAAAAKRLWPKGFPGAVLRSVRPYGGRACLPASVGDPPRGGDLGAGAVRKGDMLVIGRDGPPPGAADYEGRPNFDELVRAPLGLLWFGDTYHHHKLFAPDPTSGFLAPIGSGLPTVVRGAIRYAVTRTPYGTRPENMKRKKIPRMVYTDLYTGRAMAADELPPPRPPAGGRPAAEGEARSVSPSDATRVNPLTGIREARNVMKGYGCDGKPVDYGHLYTMRSGTAAYYDKRTESGTVNISGLRSGCRNNIIPAGGVLALPYWLGNCTCNYPNHTSLALAPMPETYEQWAAWGPVAVEAPIQRIGLNFGAPGDRTVADGALWLEVPSIGGPSPEVDVAIEPTDVKFTYRRSGWMRGGSGWPWVAASNVEGIRSLAVVPVARRARATRNTYSVRWTGKLLPAATETTTFHAVSDHGFRVWVDGKLVLDNQKGRRRGRPVTVSRTVELEAGRAVPLTMEYTRPRPTAVRAPGRAELAWSSASVPRSVIPPANFLTFDDEPGGITGAYYHTEDLKGPGVLRKDPRIRFDWGSRIPAPLARPRKPVVPRERYTVRLTFAEPEDLEPGQRVFSVALQGRVVLEDLDVVSEAGGPMRGLMKEFRGVAVKNDISLTFTPKTGQPILSGLEILAE